jgi:predicted flavoprotein YhiN
MKRAGVVVVHATAEEIIVEDGRAAGVKCRGGEYRGGAVILAVGGASYPGTGSTGDGYAMAEKAGHTVVPPRPSLVPLECADACCAQMQGLSLRNAALTVKKLEEQDRLRGFRRDAVHAFRSVGTDDTVRQRAYARFR